MAGGWGPLDTAGAEDPHNMIMGCGPAQPWSRPGIRSAEQYVGAAMSAAPTLLLLDGQDAT
jgi:hypothetical protein